jgi:peptide/nickel transport system substrate-binding protein
MIYPQPQLDLVQQIKRQPDVTSEIRFGLSYEHLTLNFKNEFLAQPQVRLALAKALDRDDIVRRTVAQFDPKASRLDGRIWLTGQPEYEAHPGEYAQRDLAGAQQLLEQAGFTKGADGIYAKGGKRLSLRISTTAGNALREQQETLIQAQAKEAGIEIKIVNAPAEKLFGEWLPQGNFDIANFAWVGTVWPIASTKSTFETGGGQNYGKYSNPQVDQLLRQAVGELDRTKSVELSNQADEILSRDIHSIPLYQKPTFFAYRNTYGGVRDNATSDSPFNQSYFWGLKAATQ